MENRICDLPDDLLLLILILVPTKVAVTTTILSKRWRFVSKMLRLLEFNDDGNEKLGWFIDQSLQLHKAPKLRSLIVELGPSCTVDVDVGKWIEYAVNRGVYVLDFKLLWTAKPTSFPKSLYTCDTIVDLSLSNEIFVDVSSQARLPSLLRLSLLHVVYKDEDSLVRLLSSSPILNNLTVERHEEDNLTNFTVKVPSLQILYYVTTWRNKDGDDDRLTGSLVIDAPALTKFDIIDVWDYYCLIENMPCLVEAYIGFVPNPNDKFLRNLVSVRHLLLCLTEPMVECCTATKFSWLIEFYFRPEESVDWLDSLMFLLQNSPKLKTLMIKTEPQSIAPSWNQPNSIPGCLSSNLEIFGWVDYGGREDEKQLVTYILANAECLKKVEISFLDTSNLEEKQKELQSSPRISSSCQLLFPTQVEWDFS
ncbi:putative F-box/FBD/LRR-repeat protein At1g22000 [Brassica rapa]|uniref:BnaA09g29290D protein n=3 Tax=Brassica TaxID=3705 RepID=A0A078FP17_BRANA|nr:putative F-box/FBD/LRR-repeat protein At1g22000 [Brassica rapa]XP_022547515.1 putative F-box/FBD/LRR-repeat protein At1g22000 [Brassica napus]XP_033135139.1 putative F-box/FBD/LRR-repeat protein At1g22000 [Brassica rapa]KAH0911524.1 hypothetical protein HID58_034845 [Brassica napus]CAF2045634.1 unnamed protein product [Brassica napus]CAG7864735.1 unnamed protein product [Brassica rapa]CDY16195.1 BnaA09g29290D [Brassica napus]VDC61911.1 unnamed protein product [Brassica rapa]